MQLNAKANEDRRDHSRHRGHCRSEICFQKDERPKSCSCKDYVFGGFATSAWEPCGRLVDEGQVTLTNSNSLSFRTF